MTIIPLKNIPKLQFFNFLLSNSNSNLRGRSDSSDAKFTALKWSMMIEVKR
jgi:hypothetical protein